MLPFGRGGRGACGLGERGLYHGGPRLVLTEGKTAVYAWNDTAAPKVALLDAGTTLPILKEEGQRLIVSLRGAAG